MKKDTLTDEKENEREEKIKEEHVCKFIWITPEISKLSKFIFMQTENTDFIYKNDLDKSCLQHDMANGKYKYLTKRTQSDKVFKRQSFSNYK